MALLVSPQTADPLTTRVSNVVLPRARRSFIAAQTRAGVRPRSATFATRSRSSWSEAAILSALSWLGDFLVEGLIHCAFAHHAGDPKLIQRILDERKMTVQAERRRTVLEVRP